MELLALHQHWQQSHGGIFRQKSASRQLLLENAWHRQAITLR